MPITRLVHMTYPAEKADNAARYWKESCAPLMAAQSGCLAEELLRRGDVPTEFVSFSLWDNEASIRKYLESDSYQKIRAHNLDNGATHVTIRLYEQA